MNIKRSARRRQDAASSYLVTPETGEADPASRPGAHAKPTQALHRSLAALPQRQRLAVVLRYFQGLSSREIGAVLECSEETARNTLLRSLRKLRDRPQPGPRRQLP